MISRLLMISSLVWSVTAVGLSAADDLSLDAAKSKIGFVGTKTDGKHEGGFKKFTATAAVDSQKSEVSSLSIVIDTSSLWSDDPKLTNHLKSPDFFDVRKYPKITFESTGFEAGEEAGQGTVLGVMTMLGKEVEVKIPVELKTDKDMAAITADFKIDRTKWGMTYGVGKVDKDVAVKAVLVFKR